MITHEEVRINIEINYGILVNYYSDEQSKNSIKKEKENMLNYITQQEKKDELLGLYQTLYENNNDHDYDLAPDLVGEMEQRIETLEKELEIEK